MNYWKQFAEMLGLEAGEEFSLTKSNGEKVNEDTYRITEDGIYYQSVSHSAWWAESAETLGLLLMGDIKAVPKPWKPKEGKEYWYYSEAWKQGISTKWESGIQDLFFWKAGNCFRTKEEADAKGKEIIEQIRKEFEEA